MRQQEVYDKDYSRMGGWREVERLYSFQKYLPTPRNPLDPPFLQQRLRF